jgi:hypothetical protein
MYVRNYSPILGRLSLRLRSPAHYLNAGAAMRASWLELNSPRLPFRCVALARPLRSPCHMAYRQCFAIPSAFTDCVYTLSLRMHPLLNESAPTSRVSDLLVILRLRNSCPLNSIAEQRSGVEISMFGRAFAVVSSTGSAKSTLCNFFTATQLSLAICVRATSLPEYMFSLNECQTIR